jgi:tetratricopeptide (TPR) repeat protein
MRQSHAAGDKLFVDYAGDGIPVVIDRLTGKQRTAQIFVAVLGASSLTYAQATWTQGLADWWAILPTLNYALNHKKEYEKALEAYNDALQRDTKNAKAYLSTVPRRLSVPIRSRPTSIASWVVSSSRNMYIRASFW